MNTDHSASIVLDMANTLMLYSHNVETLPDYKLRVIMDSLPALSTK